MFVKNKVQVYTFVSFGHVHYILLFPRHDRVRRDQVDEVGIHGKPYQELYHSYLQPYGIYPKGIDSFLPQMHQNEKVSFH